MTIPIRWTVNLICILLTTGCTTPVTTNDPPPTTPAPEPWPTNGTSKLYPIGWTHPANDTTPNLKPLKVMDAYVGTFAAQGPDALSGGGFVDGCLWVVNTNAVDVITDLGIEIYHSTSGGDLTLRERLDWYGSRFFVNSSASIFKSHWVSHREMANNGASNKYTVHLWHEILVFRNETEPAFHFSYPPTVVRPRDPPLREDLWYNLTYIPYTTRTTTGNDMKCSLELPDTHRLAPPIQPRPRTPIA